MNHNEQKNDQNVQQQEIKKCNIESILTTNVKEKLFKSKQQTLSHQFVQQLLPQCPTCNLILLWKSYGLNAKNDVYCTSCTSSTIYQQMFHALIPIKGGWWCSNCYYIECEKCYKIHINTIQENFILQD